LFEMNTTTIFRGDLQQEILIRTDSVQMCVVVSAPPILPYILSVPSDAVYSGDTLINEVVVSIWQDSAVDETSSYYFNNATGQLVRILIGNSNSYTQIDYLSMIPGPVSKSAFDIPKGLNCSEAKVEGKLLSKPELEHYLDIKPDWISMNPTSPKPMAEFTEKVHNNETLAKRVDPATIIMIGKQIWQIIVDNKPSSTVNTNSNAVIPQGAGFTDMSGWKQYAWQPFQWRWTNPYGITVVDFQWSFDWNCQGNYRGVGKYIQNAGAFPKAINVAWGYTVSVDAQMLQPTNIGTQKNPVAAVTFYMTMKISTIIKTASQSCKAVLQGDCGSILIFCDQYS